MNRSLVVEYKNFVVTCYKKLSISLCSVSLRYYEYHWNRTKRGKTYSKELNNNSALAAAIESQLKIAMNTQSGEITNNKQRLNTIFITVRWNSIYLFPFVTMESVSSVDFLQRD